jgi:hypothetical protein
MKIRSISLASIAYLTITMTVSSAGAPHTTQPATLDGIGVGYNMTRGCGPYVCASQLLNTTNSGDIVIIVADCVSRVCRSNLTSVSDSSGLRFSQRLYYDPSYRIWEYYGLATAALLNDNITVAFDGDSEMVQVFAITGSSYDPNLPIASPCGSADGIFGPNTCSVAYTSSNQEFAFAIVAMNDAPPCAVSEGFTRMVMRSSDLEIDYRNGGSFFSCEGTDPTGIVVDGILSATPEPS